MAEPATKTLATFDPLEPSWRALAVIFALALLGFLLPQEIPLVFRPLDLASPDQLFLELTCRADRDGELQIYLVSARAVDDRDSIRIPLSASDHLLTYDFPLADVPLIALRLDPPARGATLTVARFVLRDRAGRIFRSFAPADLQPNSEVATLKTLSDGTWRITSHDQALDPFASVNFGPPLVPVGMNGRNFARVALSWSYLLALIFATLLAVHCVFPSAEPRLQLRRRGLFLFVIAALFSTTAHRGLIKESLTSARIARDARR